MFATPECHESVVSRFTEKDSIVFFPPQRYLVKASYIFYLDHPEYKKVQTFMKEKL